MTDNKSSAEQSNSENKSDNVTLAKTESTKTAPAKNINTYTSGNKNTSTSHVTNAPSSPWSKTALLAVVLSLFALTGIGASYFWSMQQQQLLVEQITQNTLALQQENKQKIQQLLNEQQKQTDQHLQQWLSKAQSENNVKIAQLTTSLARIAQKQPSDWLVHEAEYLVRVASRTMWLERDTRAAIALLNDANDRLKELDSPKYLPVRQLIHQDIEALQLMPVLETNEAVLILMALNNQVNELPLAMVNLAEVSENETNLSLSDNAADWQANLQKTWQKFLNDFITVRRRSGSVEPLMSPQQQQHLRQNLSLKIHLALWAASEEKTKIYQQSLNEIGQWLSHYFDMENDINKRFYQRIDALKPMLISFSYPTDLSSLSAIRTLLTDNSTVVHSAKDAVPVQLPELAPMTLTEEVKAVETNIKKTPSTSKIEGSL